MMRWIPFELHNHTYHSDGGFTPAELANHARQDGFVGAALTDHNTASGIPEFLQAAKQCGLTPIEGIEWTTYHGHMVVLGCEKYVDWRPVGLDQIDEAIDEIHRYGGVCGIAHPFAVANPVNTGYLWEFKIHDWSKPDYIEVWSRDCAPIRVRSKKAFALWEDLLQKGFRLPATSGRDWHRPDPEPTAQSCTLLGIEGEISAEAALQALRGGHVCITAGPSFIPQFSQDGHTLHPGDLLKAGQTEITCTTNNAVGAPGRTHFEIVPKSIALVQNTEILCELPYQPQLTFSANLRPGWARVELRGEYCGMPSERIAFSSPVYID